MPLAAFGLAPIDVHATACTNPIPTVTLLTLPADAIILGVICLGIPFIAGDVSRTTKIPAGNFKLCVTDIEVRVQNPLLAPFGYIRELVPAFFELSVNKNPEFAFQDEVLNEGIKVFTQWRAEDGRKTSPEAAEIASVLGKTGFQAKAPEYKAYVGHYPGLPKSISVY